MKRGLLAFVAAALSGAVGTSAAPVDTATESSTSLHITQLENANHLVHLVENMTNGSGNNFSSAMYLVREAAANFEEITVDTFNALSSSPRLPATSLLASNDASTLQEAQHYADAASELLEVVVDALAGLVVASPGDVSVLAFSRHRHGYSIHDHSRFHSHHFRSCRRRCSWRRGARRCPRRCRRRRFLQAQGESPKAEDPAMPQDGALSMSCPECVLLYSLGVEAIASAQHTLVGMIGEFSGADPLEPHQFALLNSLAHAMQASVIGSSSGLDAIGRFMGENGVDDRVSGSSLVSATKGMQVAVATLAPVMEAYDAPGDGMDSDVQPNLEGSAMSDAGSELGDDRRRLEEVDVAVAAPTPDASSGYVLV